MVKGSKKWIQKVINCKPEILNSELKKTGVYSDQEFCWVSPLKSEEYKEYRDQKFLDALDLDLKTVKLKNFWPSRGANWDALGKTSSGCVLLVEAKAHVTEIDIGGTGATDPKSKQLIHNSLEEVKKYLLARDEVDWSVHFYQTTNRLAHLYLLRVLNSIDAYLVNVYFLNDEERGGPRTVREWKSALKLLKKFLGISDTKLDKFILDIFIDVNDLCDCKCD